MKEERPEFNNLSELKSNLDHLRNSSITKLENINISELYNIKRVSKDCEESFDKIWIFILEIYYGVSASKYKWADFSKRIFSKK